MRFSLDDVAESPIPMKEPRSRICLPSDDDLTPPDSRGRMGKRSVGYRDMTSVTSRSRKVPTMSIAYSSPSSPMGPGIAGSYNSSIEFESPIHSPPQPLKRSRPSLFQAVDSNVLSKGHKESQLTVAPSTTAATDPGASKPEITSDSGSLSISVPSISSHLKQLSSTEAKSDLPPLDLEQWQYPEAAVPPKALLNDLVQQALEDDVSDQSILKYGGIMSFEEVLLPALALQEEAALKKLQARVQRDAPILSTSVETCRKVVRRSILTAIQNVQEQRQARLKRQALQRADALAAKRAQLENLRQQMESKRRACKEAALEWVQNQRESDRRNQTRNLPRNKALWKEIVVLTRSKTQLEKEERMWKQTMESLVHQNKQATQDTANENDNENDKNDANKSMTPKPVQPMKDPVQIKTESTLHDMVLASKRIQEGLLIVLQVLQDSEQARKDLYHKYRTQHQFRGYQGVRNPRNLIRFLSQED